MTLTTSRAKAQRARENGAYVRVLLWKRQPAFAAALAAAEQDLSCPACTGAAIRPWEASDVSRPPSPCLITAPGQSRRAQARTPRVASVQPVAALTYTVWAGATLGAIAVCYGTTWQHLAFTNSISNPNLIRVAKF
jgi:hypothetical protein